MAIKFLSGLNLSNVTAGSILKLDANGNIVAAVDGTDYISTSGASIWSTTQGGIYSSDEVRIGTYQTDLSPDARLHVFDYQTTTPKILIEDGNTGDASMQFKISTQSYTIGIDNSDSDKFVLSASGGLGTSNILEITSTGIAAFQNSVLVKGEFYVNSSEQIQQGGTFNILSLQNSSVEHGSFQLDGSGNGYFIATGFKTSTASTGFLKADGSVDTGDFFSGAYGDLTGTPTLGTMAAANTSDYKTSDEVESYVALELTGYTSTTSFGTNAFTSFTDHSTQGYLTSYTETDTLDSVTGRGATTTNAITVGGLTVDTDTLYVDATNNRVGIGTTSPGGRLDVQASNTGVHLARVWNTNTAGTGASVIRIANSGNNSNGNRIEFTDQQYYTATISGDRTQGIVFRTSATGSDPIAIDERMRITPAGNVGIGVTNPSRKLQVDSAAGYPLSINSTQQYLMEFARNGVSEWWFAVNNGDFKFHENGVGDQVVIKSGGNVGIGTTSPEGAIDVRGGFGRWRINGYGGMYFRNDSDTGNTRYIHARSDGGLSIGRAADTALLSTAPNQYFDLSKDQLYISAAGNVGIGTTSPAQKLEVNGGSSYPDIRISATGLTSRYLEIGMDSAVQHSIGAFGAGTYLTFKTVGTDRMVIDASGNVGIGTTSPNHKLDVRGSGYFLGDTSVPNAPTALGFYLGKSAGADENRRLEIVSPSGGVSYIDFTKPSVDYRGRIAYYDSDDTFRLYTAAAEKLRITSTGNVGIGTTAPSQKLQVSGIAEVAGALRVTESGTAQHILIGNQDSGGTNKPAMIRGVNGQLHLGHGNSWTGEGGTMTYAISIDSGGVQFPQYGAGLLKTDANGVVSLDTSDYATKAFATSEADAVQDNLDSLAGSLGTLAYSSATIPTNNNQLTNGAGYITSTTASLTIGAGVTLSESTDRADLLYINSSTSGWGGLQIGNTSNEFIFSLMGNGNAGGIYDDQNDDWIIYWDENAGVILHHNGNQKIRTVSDGVNVTGRLYASTGVQVPYSAGEHRPMVVLNGATSYGLFHTEATKDKFTFDFDGDQKFQFSQDGILTVNGNTITTGKITNWDTAYDWGNHASAGYATQSYVNTAVSNLVDAAPGTLDTLNELAAALGDDPNFATTVTNSIATKVPLSGAATISGVKTFETVTGGNEDWLNSPISILERDTIGYSSADSIYAPNINFNWRSRVSRSLWMDATGDFHFGEYSSTGVPGNTGAIYVGGGNSTNWNTAFGWGNHAGLYDAVGSAQVVNARIDSEVLPSIPTNNNQLTNGAGYITSSSSISGSAATSTAASIFDLLPSARATYAWSVQLTAGTWADIFSSTTVLSSGTWMVQVFVNDFAVGGQQYLETYSGIMSWGQANSTNLGGNQAISEIVLHRSGHAANSGNFYLRTVERVTSTLVLQGMSNLTYTAASTINFKFVKVF